MQKKFTSCFLASALAMAGCNGPVAPPPSSALPAAAPEVGQLDSALTPTGVTPFSNDTYSPQLETDIATALKENRSVPVTHPELLPPNLVPDLYVVENLCQVWVSFYSEGAGFKNTLGYFVYPNGSPPSSVPLATRQGNVIFSNASASGSGGSLVKGNRVQLGTGTNTTFSAGSRIGFYLVADGFANGTSVDFNKTTYYTVDALNTTESVASKKRHALIVSHADSKRQIMGFEDLHRSGGGADDDFNDVVFTINWAPESCIVVQNPGIDPDSSCQAAKTRVIDEGKTPVSGWYSLDPCGTKTPETYYCDMDKVGANGIKGGWTVPGWQQASATTSLGVEKRGTPSDTATNWSRPLKCMPFNEVMVFNKTSNQYFTDTLRGSQFRVNSVPYALGEAGHSFNQGTYSLNSSAKTMQGCVAYNYDGTLNAAWGCTSDNLQPQFSAKGHIADESVDWHCDPVPNYDPARKWAWANNTSCSNVSQDYLWGIGIR